jgi:hypothetical protein
MLATAGENLGLSSPVLHRIVNHASPKTNVLHRHYVGWRRAGDVLEPMVRIQVALVALLGDAHRVCSRGFGRSNSVANTDAAVTLGMALALF